VLKIGYVKTNN